MFSQARWFDIATTASYSTHTLINEDKTKEIRRCPPLDLPQLTWVIVYHCLIILNEYHCKGIQLLVFFSNFLTILLFQITLLIAGIGWGDTTSRKIIYWGMLTGDILLIAIQSAFVHSMSEWHAFNIAIVTLASAFGLFRIITLIFNPSWWLWVPEPNFWVTAIC